jgi:hypothetical protein
VAVTRLRFCAAFAGGLALPLVVLVTLPDGGSAGWGPPFALGVALALFMVGELWDRRLFFLASVAPRRYGDIR